MKLRILAFAMAVAFFPAVSFSANPNKEIDSIVKTFWKTSPLELNEARVGAMFRMQKYMDAMPHKQFGAYKAMQDEAARREAENGTVLRYMQASMDKLVKEIPSTKVEKGTVAVWLLYNMGYVVKTPSRCFGVDIMHPEAGRLIPYLDFLLITHKHGDHFTHDFNRKMIDAGKKVYTNWDGDDYATTNLTSTPTLYLDDIKIESSCVDHNAKHRKFVIIYQVDCGEDTGHTNILFLGDACDYKQINPSHSIDIMIPHLEVGLKMKKLLQKVDPKWTLFSHIQELGHPKGSARWTYFRGLDQITYYQHPNLFLPVWGDRIIYRKN